MMNIKTLWKTLGPGMLYAGAAIGVSHLVQSTRAGAQYGHTLWWIILFSNFIKYPFFEFGPRYASATGESLLHGYKKLGNWALLIYIIMTILTMFAIQAAVTVVTAGLIENMFNLGLSAPVWSVILMLVCAAILLFGRYHLLNATVKWIILTLTVTTLLSLIMAKKPITNTFSMPDFSWTNQLDILFVVALMGWMPAPIDLAVWHSTWSNAQDADQAEKTTFKNQMLDFNIGYIGTAILAVCFMGLGAIVMHGSGTTFSDSAHGFAKQLIELFTSTIGSWSYPIISIAAFCTMLSTTITLLDAFPRSLRTSGNLLLNQKETHRQYNVWLLITIIGTSLVLFFFMKNMKGMVDLATTISFVVAPILAVLNTIVIQSKQVPAQYKPSKMLMTHAVVGILFLSLFSGYYIWIRFF
jgi:Mn2+/Fe2+ NRAMP family transporter